MKTDFLVIGSGLSGLYFALNAPKKSKCIIATKGNISDSNTKFAQGGIAAVFGKDDSFESHIKDTLAAGAGLCNKRNVGILVKNGPKEIKRLLSYNISFDKANGFFELGKEGAHSFRRVLHHKDATGAEIEKKLAEAARENKNTAIKENTILVELLARDKKCCGAIVFDEDKNSLSIIEANCVVLATGGIGQIYKYTTNPEIATGDGIASAFEAGAKIENMEFVQFHPTALKSKSGKNFLISESLRGEGAFLINEDNERFVKHKLKELAPRDILSREVFHEMKKNKVYLDISHKGKEFIKSRFPNIYSECLKHGIDITKDKIPISPAAHFLCGGIKTNSYGQTTIKNLFAVGECACTGVHGANRLASNSLLECMVFSARAAKKAKGLNNSNKLQTHYNLKKYKIIKSSPNAEKNIVSMQNKIKKIMWDYAGIIRTRKGLLAALGKIKKLELDFKNNFGNKISRKLIETKNMIAVSRLIVKASLGRRKSAGAFYIED